MPSKLGNTKWYTLQEVADVLGKSYGTINTRVKAGEIPFSEISNNRVVEHKDLLALMKDDKLPEEAIKLRLSSGVDEDEEKVVQTES